MRIVDAMNVRGSVPDGWWADRDGALRRLVAAIAAVEWDEWVIVVADGRPIDGLPAGTRGRVELCYAGHSAPDAADDVIVELAWELVADLDPGTEPDPIIVVTSDRGLVSRLPAGVDVQGARAFRRRIGA